MINRVKLNPLLQGKIYRVFRGDECVAEISAHSAVEALQMIRMEFGHEYANNACLKDRQDHETKT